MKYLPEDAKIPENPYTTPNHMGYDDIFKQGQQSILSLLIEVDFIKLKEWLHGKYDSTVYPYVDKELEYIQEWLKEQTNDNRSR